MNPHGPFAAVEDDVELLYFARGGREGLGLGTASPPHAKTGIVEGHRPARDLGQLEVKPTVGLDGVPLGRNDHVERSEEATDVVVVAALMHAEGSRAVVGHRCSRGGREPDRASDCADERGES